MIGGTCVFWRYVYWRNRENEESLSEIDISVSKLLGFETFAKSLRVSVSENLVSEKKSRFRFRKNLVSENLVSENKKSKLQNSALNDVPNLRLFSETKFFRN